MAVGEQALAQTSEKLQADLALLQGLPFAVGQGEEIAGRRRPRVPATGGEGRGARGIDCATSSRRELRACADRPLLYGQIRVPEMSAPRAESQLVRG